MSNIKKRKNVKKNATERLRENKRNKGRKRIVEIGIALTIGFSLAVHINATIQFTYEYNQIHYNYIQIEQHHDSTEYAIFRKMNTAR